MAMVGWMAAGMEVVDGMHAVKGHGGWSHVARCQSIFRVRDDTLMTPPSRCPALGRVESELVSFPAKSSTLDPTRRLRFVVRAAGGAPLAHCCRCQSFRFLWGCIN